jgi:hypothetical protein
VASVREPNETAGIAMKVATAVLGIGFFLSTILVLGTGCSRTTSSAGVEASPHKASTGSLLCGIVTTTITPDTHFAVTPQGGKFGIGESLLVQYNSADLALDSLDNQAIRFTLTPESRSAFTEWTRGRVGSMLILASSDLDYVFSMAKIAGPFTDASIMAPLPTGPAAMDVCRLYGVSK